MSSDVTLILPTQLFIKHPGLDKRQTVLLYEHPTYFTAHNYHKQKLILHRASMRAYYDFLKNQQCHVIYVTYKESLTKYLKNTKTLSLCDPVDHGLLKQLQTLTKKLKIKLTITETPQFLSPLNWLKKQLTGKKQYRAASFYQAQRKRLKILVYNGKPVGGKWSFDAENRQPIPEKLTLPIKPRTRTNTHITEAKKYVAKNFPKNLGDGSKFYYPTTRTEALRWFNQFLKKKLIHFGDYEDALIDGRPFLFHSILSPLLNIGLLTPEEVVQKTLDYAQKNKKITLNNIEGFIRQVIGWREFVRGIYHFHGARQRKSNKLRYRKKLPLSLYDGTTGIYPIDSTIKQLNQYAFGHHIQRLMVLGNFMFLCNIKPTNVYTWFMEFFIDAYDWVMVPNIFGMSQYADGGLMTTKPYFSGSNYILTMSNYKKDKWCSIWDGLYWRFIAKHTTLLKNNPRWSMMVNTLKKMNREKQKELLENAETFLKQLK